MAEFLTLDQVAERIGVEITTVRRAARQIHADGGLEILKGKVPGRSRSALCVSDLHAQVLVDHFHNKQSNPGLYAATQGVNSTFNGYGYFYLIQLIPEILPDRVKIGYTDNMDNRLKEHQTAAPTARLVKSWRCKRAWDQAAMDSITSNGCHLVMNEVYEGNVQGFVDRGDRFFAVMPTEETKVPLSEHSPLTERGADA